MKSVYFFLSCAGLALAAALFTFRDAPTPPLQPEAQRADTVLIDRTRHRLTLLRDDEVLAKFPVAVAPNPSRPECAASGTFEISQRNPKRLYRLSLGLEDTSQSRGGRILIHGRPRVPQAALALFSDRMRGCIGVSNPEMKEIWSRVTIGTEVVIR